MGIGLPIKINNVITVYGYGAYSYQWEGLVGTEPSTFWGGAKVTSRSRARAATPKIVES